MLGTYGEGRGPDDLRLTGAGPDHCPRQQPRGAGSLPGRGGGAGAWAGCPPESQKSLVKNRPSALWPSLSTVPVAVILSVTSRFRFSSVLPSVFTVTSV